MRKQTVIPDNLLPFIMIAGAVTLYFSSILFTNNTFFVGDLYTQFYPWKDFAKNSLQSGTVPFWNPYVFSGVPFIADVQKGILYPPGIVFLLFDFPAALKIYLMLHFILAGFSVYVLAKSLGCDPAPAFAASLIFIFNSFFASKVNNLAALGSAAFLPAILYTFKLFIDRKKATFFILGCALLSLSFLAGHFRTFINSLFFCLLFFAFYISFFGAGFRISRMIKLLAASAAALIITFCLTMPQSGLFAELLFNSAITIVSDYVSSSVNSMGFLNFFSMTAPPDAGYASLSGWNDYSKGINVFFSATFIFLLIASLFRKKNSLYYFSLIVFILALLIALGKNTPVHSFFLKFLPFLAEPKFPGTALSLLMLPAAFIAAVSMASLYSPSDGKIPEKSALLWLLYAMLPVPALLVIFNRGLSFAFGLDNETILAMIKGTSFFILMYILNYALYFLKEKHQIKPAFYHALLIALIFSELYTFMARANPAAEQNAVYGKKNVPETAQLMRTSSYKFGHIGLPEKGSVYLLDYITRSERNFFLSIPSCSGMSYGLFDAFGHNDLKLLNYSRFISRMNTREGYNRDIINLLNLKYIISGSSLDKYLYEELFDKYSVKIYKNEAAYPLFFMSENIRIPKMQISQVSWTRKNEYEFGNLRVNISNEQQGWLIFCNSFYPGWTAYVDNMSEKIQQCFGLYMGVSLPPGTHEIIFNYTPENYIYYKIIFALAFIFFLVLGAVKLISLKK